MKLKLYLLFISVLLLLYTPHAQNLYHTANHPINYSDEKIIIDGKLDENIWKISTKGSGFYQTFPTDNMPAKDSTVFMLCYNDQFIYVAVICYDSLPGSPVTTTLKRDFSWIRNDNISLYLDPYNDRSNGFTFQVTPNNVQREGLVVLGGEVQDNWDNKWYSAVSKGEKAWYAELAIPFKSFRYNSVPEWNIQFIRNNQKRNERTTWINTPQQFRPSDLVYTGKLKWDKNPPKAGTNFAVIPYVSTSAAKDFEEGQPTEIKPNTGFDAKIGLSNSLNLDLTVNPDFSQVEVDRQVTNLQRFELVFPERRQFFLENQDLFARTGFTSSRPFFSRRIGIQGSGSSRRNVPIIAGARLSGKIGNKWRTGLLNMVTNQDKTEDEIVSRQNYSVAVLERQIFERSRITGIFVGRTNLGQSMLDTFLVDSGSITDKFGNKLLPEDTLVALSKYNYVYGFDYNLATVNNRWTGKFYYHRSLDPKRANDNFSQGAFLRYQTRQVRAGFFTSTQGDNYNAEVGFVRRTGTTRSGAFGGLNFYPKGIVQRHGPSTEGNFVINRSYKLLDYRVSTRYEIEFLNSSSLSLGSECNYVTLTNSFDPSGSSSENSIELAEGSNHNWIRYGIAYQSDQRKNFFFSLFAENGNFYNGTRLNLASEINFRLPPILQVQINFEYNKINLPEPYSNSELLLAGPRIDLTLNNKVFFTTFIQYNTQDKNFGHNSRFQWRFKPVSDLYVVYTDNYFTDGFTTRNRALVIKVSYWLNI